MTEPKVIMKNDELEAVLQRLTWEIIEDVKTADDIALIGIRTRGVHIARRIQAILEEHFKIQIPLGILDITLYRDDLSQLASQPIVRPTELSFDVSAKRIFLVDDVLFTGRTIRAAMDQLVDFGRPRMVRLVAMIDRGWREYPIQPDYVGAKVQTGFHQIVHVRLNETDGEDTVLLLS